LTEARVVLQYADEAVKKARAAAGGTNGEINVGYAPSLGQSEGKVIRQQINLIS
jgi:hypothetical protein